MLYRTFFEITERDIPEDRFAFNTIRPERELVRIGVQVENETCTVIIL
jgi:hypothetical protein